MSLKVILPQIGQSIAEATIVKWFKKPGDSIQKGETLVEIGTDKVNTEIPAPDSGIVEALLVPEGETVPVNTEIAVLAATTEQSSHRQAAPRVDLVTKSVEGRAARMPDASEHYSPVVRKLAKEHNLDLASVPGTGTGGRVTREDVLKVAAQRGATQPQTRRGSGPVEAPPEDARKEGVRRVSMSRVRKLIAEHMSLSRRTAADVTTFFEIDMSAVVAEREKAMQIFEKQHGVKLTYLPFIIDAVTRALRAFPILNSSIEGDQILYRNEIHVGIAVAVEEGLLVPVIRNADRKNILELAKAAQDVSERVRRKRLSVEELQDGTFTITNPGVFGALMGTPIIHQPQVAILGVGAIAKRAVVINDAIGIRPVAYFSLSYDHRALDGSTADSFLAHIKNTLENHCASALDRS
jgi:2-oxoglutarate dehydrogenase complex dihydrolipoamide succinyltransferase (E2) component